MSATGVHATRAVFLDRDGTLLDELGYLGDPDGVRLLPGAATAVRRLQEAGLQPIVVTNQSGIARGLFDEDALARVHARMLELFEAEGARILDVLYCPHHPEFGSPPYRMVCECRKPEPGLLREAALRHELELARCAVIGDAARDLEAGRRAGVSSRILVRTGKGRQALRDLTAVEAHGLVVVDDILAATDWLLRGAAH